MVLDVDAWRARAEAVRSVDELEVALGAIGMHGRGGDWSDESACPSAEDDPRRVGVVVDVSRARLTAAGPESVLVRVRAGSCHGSQIDSGVVLLPLSDGYCRAGYFLSQGGIVSGFGQICEEPSIRLERLTSPEHAVIAVRSADAWCGTSGADRSRAERVDYFEVQGSELVHIFGAVTSAWDIDLHFGPEQSNDRVSTITARGEYPRDLVVETRIHRCRPAEDERHSHWEVDEDTCQPEERTLEVWRYEDGQYRLAPAEEP